MDAQLLWKAGATLLVASFVGSAAAQRMERTAALPVGSVWVNQQSDSGSFGSGSSEVESRMVELVWEGQKVLGVKTPQTTLLVDPNGSWMGLLDKNDKAMVTWDPPLTYTYPLEVGKSSTWGYQMKLAGQDRAVPVEVSQLVESYDEVTVPAGTYKAFRVKTSDNLGQVTIAWLSPELGLFVKRVQERTDRHAQGSGQRVTELRSHNIRR